MMNGAPPPLANARRQFVGQKPESLILEPRAGIEPTFLLYESSVLPLNYIGAGAVVRD